MSLLIQERVPMCEVGGLSMYIISRSKVLKCNISPWLVPDYLCNVSDVG